MIKAYLFLKKNRSRKKWTLYKKVLLLSLDWTLILYGVVLVGYMGSVFLIEGTLLQTIREHIPSLEAISKDKISYLIVFLPFLYLLNNFRQPGIAFSQAEFVLSLLPFDKQRIWWLLALTRWVRATAGFTVLGLVYYFLSSTGVATIVLYVSVLVMMNIVMTIPGWRFFQWTIWWKLLYIFVFLSNGLLIFFVEIQHLATVMLILLLISNWIGYHFLMKNIHWGKVRSAVDYKIWNMPIISQVTKIKFKRDRKYTLWQRLPFWKKPFHDENNMMYHRLWHLHIEKNKKYIFQLIAVLLFLLTVLGFLKEWLFLLALIITIHVFSQFITALFQERLFTDIVIILPWDVIKYVYTFRFWAYSMSGIFIFPLSVYLYFHFNVYHSVSFFTLILLYVFLVEEEITKRLHLIDPRYLSHDRVYQGTVLGTVFIFIGYFNPLFLYAALLLTTFIIIWKLIHQSKTETHFLR